jgi:hypothetical protein
LTRVEVPAPAAAIEGGETDAGHSCGLRAWPSCAGVSTELIMRELVRTTDAVLISAIEALLNSARIKHLVVDQNMSVLEGSIGIFPRRILVGEDELNMARRLLEDSGFGHELRPEPR